MKANTFYPLTNCSTFSVLIFFILGSALLFSCGEEDQSISKNRITFDHLVSDQPIDVIIKTDLDRLFSKSETEEETFIKAKYAFEKEGVTIHKGKGKVRKRGITRKKICEFPPTMLKIGKGKSKLKLKIVAPCHQGDDFQQLVFREYLTYRLYSELTDYSFRTQLVNITYQDKNDEDKKMEMMGFVIEDDEHVANRMASELMRPHEKLKFIDQDRYRLFTMFQYCVGNTDWNLKKRHNIKLICKKDSKTPVPVPYDFDYAGLVNAPYAIPHPKLPIKTVRDRYFMWRGKNRKGFGRVLKIFKQKREGLFAIIKEFDYLKSTHKKDMLQYLEGFYHNIQDGSSPVAQG
ncbi:MAG: hypothetical protein AAF573_10280 [Bacteroidota bacterium]